MAHPRTTMDDITDVSNPLRVSAKNTIDVTRNMEMRSRTVLAVLVGLGVGALMGFIVGTLLPFIGVVWAVSVMIPVTVVAFVLLFAGRVRDRAADFRWRRLHQRLKSKNIDGGVFYPNSVTPEHLTGMLVERFVVWVA
ncbi:hypothetical protein GCM10007377_15580 [Galliscardovia ingluviei]|uniref:TIGR03750 family conjugal transfer protein n=1 Tax=Galliscardovia ingluviei TaxID=1769422 RepID=A0A8J3AKJ5_9BIFI|nr:hypothetical protein [Galliscardovia ingluviei]GGI15374.1 hypothetical protein GCM10007377_15580 [Galliscardovia ingluviei]